MKRLQMLVAILGVALCAPALVPHPSPEIAREHPVISAVTEAFAPSAEASDANWVGTIISTTSTTNMSTAVPFPLTYVSVVLVQTDVAVYVRQCSTSSCTVTSSNGRLIQAGVDVYLDLRSGGKFLAAIPVSAGTANTKFFVAL